MPEADLEATNSRKSVGRTCRLSAKKRKLRWWASGRAAVERDRTHLAHALSVAPGEDGELQAHGQQLGGGRGHAQLAIRLARTGECEVRGAQENKWAARTVRRWWPTNCTFRRLQWLAQRAWFRPCGAGQASGDAAGAARGDREANLASVVRLHRHSVGDLPRTDIWAQGRLFGADVRPAGAAGA